MEDDLIVRYALRIATKSNGVFRVLRSQMSIFVCNLKGLSQKGIFQFGLNASSGGDGGEE